MINQTIMDSVFLCPVKLRMNNVTWYRRAFIYVIIIHRKTFKGEKSNHYIPFPHSEKDIHFKLCVVFEIFRNML